MRVMQLIDTLRPGGAENMAVNLANLLVDHIDGSYLCCTRASGILKKRLLPQVNFYGLEKRNSLDLKALIKLSSYIRENKITIIHAHSTSYFFACLLKLLQSELKLVWHDHYGEAENISNRREPVLKVLSNYFSGVLVVNNILETWVRKNLNVDKVRQLKNFVIIPSSKENTEDFAFKGEKDSFKIICIANLRPQKNHLILIEAFEKIDIPNLELHLIGENPNTLYSEKVLKKIRNSLKSNKIFYYGPRNDTNYIISKAHIGILPSRSEGLPLVLLEYSLSGLPLICTRVGQNEEIVEGFSEIVEPNRSDDLADAIKDCYVNYIQRVQRGLKLKEKIEKEYDINNIRKDLLQFYNSLLN